MDEVRFAGGCEYNLKRLREFQYAFLKWKLIALAICTAMSLVAVVPEAIIHRDYFLLTWYSILMCSLAAIFFFTFFHQVKLNLRRVKETAGVQIVVHKTVVYDDRIEETNTATNNTVRLDFSVLKTCAVTKNQINIWSKAKQGIFIEKGRMEIGDWQACAAFIKQKIEENEEKKNDKV